MWQLNRNSLKQFDRMPKEIWQLNDTAEVAESPYQSSLLSQVQEKEMTSYSLLLSTNHGVQMT